MQGVYQRLVALQSDAVPTLSFSPGFPAADFIDCAPSVLAYGRTQADADAAADAIVATVVGHESDFTGHIYSPDEGVRLAMELAKTASKPIVIADTQDNPGAGGDSDTTGMLRALVRNNATRAAIGMLCDPQSAIAAHAAGVGATVTLALGGKSGIPGDAPFQAAFVVETALRRKIRRPGPFYGGAAWTWGRRRPCASMASGRRQLAQGAARRPGHVPLCRHRADAASHSRQQELRAFPRRLRADCREAPDLRRPGAMPADPATLPWKRLRRGIRIKPNGPAFEPEMT